MLWMIPGPKRTTERMIGATVDTVWDIVTNTENFPDIIQGAWYWGPFDRQTARPGTSFDKSHLLDEEGRTWKYYVVNWEPRRRFSMGGSPMKWDFDFQLVGRNGETQLIYTRRLNVLGWLPFYRGLMNYTVDAVKGKCEEFARRRNA